MEKWAALVGVTDDPPIVDLEVPRLVLQLTEISPCDRAMFRSTRTYWHTEQLEDIPSYGVRSTVASARNTAEDIPTPSFDNDTPGAHLTLQNHIWRELRPIPLAHGCSHDTMNLLQTLGDSLFNNKG